MKVAIRNFNGNPAAYYQVTSHSPSFTEGEGSDNFSHHIIIVDRSGSMYNDINSLKTYLKKFLTLQEYVDSGMKISLLSYSSSGDLRSHFERIEVKDVMAEGSTYLSQINEIRASGLTCISQALQKANTLIDKGEITGISLHSDGYANHLSRNSEVRNLNAACQTLSQRDNVFVNTIAYSHYADYQLLSSIANQVSGSCIRAMNIKQVFDVLHGTAKNLGANIVPTIESPIEDFDYQVLMSKTAERVNGSDSTMKISGLTEEDSFSIFRFKELTQDEFETFPEKESQDHNILYAFARAQLAEGNINLAKYALCSTRNKTLLEAHYRALTNDQLADFAEDLERALFADPELFMCEYSEEYGLSSDKDSVVTVCGILNENTSGIQVNLKKVNEDYSRRGLKRVQGKRDEKGELVKPRLKTATLSNDDYVSVNSFDVSRNKANINMLVSQPVGLYNRESDARILSVAGISLDNLTQYRNYTIVGDGEVNLSDIYIRVSDRKTFRALNNAGVISGDYHPQEDYQINFSDRPVVDFSQTAEDLDGVFEQLAKLKILSSMFNAILKDQSDSYSWEQIKELREHYLSSNLNVNFPTTTAYTNLQEALAKGEVDVRPSYKVDIGNTEILNLSKLKSANSFLGRYFVQEVDGERQKKPNFKHFFEDTDYSYKQVSSRLKVDAVDQMMKPIYEDFLGLDNNGAFKVALEVCGHGEDAHLLKTFVGISEDGEVKEKAVEILNKIQWDINRAQGRIYEESVIPLAFYISATGLLPDNLDTKAEDASSIKKKHSSLKISKSEKEGTFFQVGQNIISVFTSDDYFTVERN